jgi:hypothetical protein
VQFVSTTVIRLTIPGTIGTVPGNNGTIRVTTAGVAASVSYTFIDFPLPVICDVLPNEFTAQPSPVTFTLYGDGLGPGVAFSAGTRSAAIVPQPDLTVATATVPGAWTADQIPTGVGGVNAGGVAPGTGPALTVNPVPTITPIASRLYAGKTADTTLSVTGGTPGNGFQWSLANAPAWITIQSTGPRTAQLTATPPVNTLSAAVAGQIVVTDGLQANAVASAPVNVPVTVDAVPDLTFTALPATSKLDPDAQYTIQFGTTRATPLHLTGQVNLTAAGAAFISGTTTTASVPFDIPANCVLPNPCSPTYTLQAGTVSGNVAITGTVAASTTTTASGAPPPVAFPAQTLQQDPAPPHIDTNRISVRQTPSGFDVCVPGFTNTRQMNSVTFRFVAASGKTISDVQSSRAVDTDFAGWFTAQNTTAQGGFTLLQSFNLQGDIAAIGQVFVTLSNSVGASQEVGPIDLASAPRCVQ